MVLPRIPVVLISAYLGDCEIDGLLPTCSGGLLPPLPAFRLLQVQEGAQAHCAVFSGFVVTRPQGVVGLEEKLFRGARSGRGQRGGAKGKGAGA